MSKSQRRPSCSSNRPNLDSSRSRPDDFRVLIESRHYVELFNTFADDANRLLASTTRVLPKISDLSELPGAVDTCSAIATLFREECDVTGYAIANQAACLLKKLEYRVPLFDEEGTAKGLKKWLDAEAMCKRMNEKFWDMKSHPLTHEHTELSDVTERIRKEVLCLLGEDPPDLDEVIASGVFGPGSDSSHSYDKGAVTFKLDPALAHGYYPSMESEVEWLCENTMLAYVIMAHRPRPEDSYLELTKLLGGSPPGESDVLSHLDRVDSAKLVMVPKTISEKRVIEVGPSLAGFVQQAYDGFIRRRLLTRWGVDLRKREPNQHLAYVGSLGGGPSSPCTIDLSSASDCISFGLVASVLPPAWVRTLMRYRAKSVVVPGLSSVTTLEKFSAMGNAFTFSLMTLLFAAIVRSVMRDRGGQGVWRVYGDDIIVPQRLYKDVVHRLNLVGFTVNMEKSFSEGFFRESCGADFLLGHNVRAFYLKKPLLTVCDLFRAINSLNSIGGALPIPASCLRGSLLLLYSWVPKKLRLFGNAATSALGESIWVPYGGGSKILFERTLDTRPSKDISFLAQLYKKSEASVGQCVLPSDPPLRNERGKILITFGRSPGWGRRCRSREVAVDLLLAGES